MSNPNLRFEQHKLAVQTDLERKKLDRTQQFEARKEYARQMHDQTMQHQQHVKEYAQLSLRTVFLLNGGAIIALLALMGSIVGKSPGTLPSSFNLAPAIFVPAFTKYGIGLICAAASMMFAYLNYGFLHRMTADPGALANNILKFEDKWPGNYTAKMRAGASVTSLLGIVTGIAALFFFGWGCLQVADVFSGMK